MSINFRDLLPEYIIARDKRTFVQNLVSAWEENYNDIDGQIDGLLQITDVDDCDPIYLDYIAAMIGLNLIGIDTDIEKRTQIKNAVAAYKIKGTFKSWHIIFKTLGFDVEVDELWWGSNSVLQTTNPRPDLPTGPNDATQFLPARILTNVDLSSGIDLSQGSDKFITLAIGGTVSAVPTTITTTIDLTSFAGNPAAVTRAEIIAALNGSIPSYAPLSYSVMPQNIVTSTVPTTAIGQFFQISTTETGLNASITITGTKASAIFGITTAVGAEPVFLGTASTVTLQDTQLVSVATVKVTASTVGVWGNNISITIEDGTSPSTQYNFVILFDDGSGPAEVIRFNNLEKSVSTDTLVANVQGQTFYVNVESLGGSIFRPANGTFSLSGGNAPKNTKSPYVDIILTTPFFDPNFLNKAVYFDGRVDEVKAAHIRVRFKRIGITISDNATTRSEVLDPITKQLVPGIVQDYDDSALTSYVNAEISDILQPSCNFPTGSIGVYFHNGFIRGRDGTFTRGYSVHFPDGPWVQPSVAPASGSGALPPGLYLVSYTYQDHYGETLSSPITPVMLTSLANDNSILIGSLSPLDTDLVGVDYYISQAPYDPIQKRAAFSAGGGAQVINNLPVGPVIPTTNTSTRVGLANEPGASNDVPGYVYAYDGTSGLTYGTVLDSVGQQFIYGFTFDPAICDVDILTTTITGTGPGGSLPINETSFYGVTVDMTPMFNGAYNSNGIVTYNSQIFGPDTAGTTPILADPDNTVSIVMFNPATSEAVTVVDWRYQD